ncbi:3-hydroxyacyl-[acyl-carrier-protein] dehydratase FabZ [Candidatus Poribacteria bacterium]|nr:MAG: 3-hydroxyacyl-[acyl-carrier-protein] dehydratase FabZ [Candidatus Poribacteria bacterium]
MEGQRTIEREVEIKGVGLMLGRPVTLRLKPAGPDEGVVFVRTDLEGQPSVRLAPENISIEIPHSTCLKEGKARVVGVEHLVSALVGLGVDNVRAEIDSEELPICDGSALPFVQAIKNAGIKELGRPKKEIALDRPIYLSNGERQLIALPSDSFEVTFVFDHPKLPQQVAAFKITPEVFEKEIAPARTFCLESEAEELKSQGFGSGGSEENVVLIADGTGEPKVELRFPDEFVRHKILDLVGDIGLLGYRLKAHVVAIRSGHEFNVEFVKKLAFERGKLPKPIEAAQIYQVLPHRFPFMMVDRVLAIEPEKRIVALKNVTFNEEFFQGHFPDHPVMPAVLQVEALAQAGGYLMMHGAGKGAIGYFAAIDNAKFRRPVLPGDQLILEVEVVRLRGRFGKLRGVAWVDGEVAAEAEFTITLASEGDDRNG